jgi:hypothetical protein
MHHELVHHAPKVSFVQTDDRIQAFWSRRADPALSEGSGGGCLKRREPDLDAFRHPNRVKGVRKLGVTVMDEQVRVRFRFRQ